MRVFPVSQVLIFDERNIDRLRGNLFPEFASQEACNRCVITGSVSKCLLSKFLSKLECRATVIERINQKRVILWVDNYRHIGMVFGGSSNHCGSTDINLLDGCIPG